MSADCIFCKIVDGQIPAKVVYQDEQVLAFHDINPIAPVHVLLIPRQHIATVNDVGVDQEAVMGHLLAMAPKVADLMGVKEKGYRLFFNIGRGGGQVVMHVHMHLVAGASPREMMKHLLAEHE